MELIEKPNLKAVKFLNTISFNKFKEECYEDAIDKGEKRPTIKDIKTWYSILQQFCKTNLKTKGITKRIYSYSQNTPAGLGGRLFSGGSLQGIWGVYRGLLMRGIGTDIDMSNCHPVLLKFICKKHDIPCPNLEYYINHRDECLNEFSNRKQGKNAYLIATNNDVPLRGSNLPKTLKKYDKEMKDIQKQLVALPDYKNLQETIPDYKLSKNYNGSVINRILCYYENIVLQHAIHVINTKGIEIAILMFDGLMVYGDFYNNPELLQDIEKYVEEQMPDLNMKWAYKEHDTTLQIPDDFDEDAEENNRFSFDEICKTFEKTHAKIINPSVFIAEDENKVIIKSRQQMIMSYEHLKYQVMGDDGYKSVSFINDWFSYPKMRVFRDYDIYPNTDLCPPDIYNMWRPFEMERYKNPYDKNMTALNMFLNHIKILCNNEEPVYDYICKWIGQMIQYPEVKSIMPTFISDEGAGKGTFINLLRKMLGSDKVYETTQPSQHVWGQFNGIMCNAFLVNLDELSKKEMVECEGRFKGLVTNNALTINNKGINAFPITSYHRFISTTNKRDPIKTSNGDRRNLIISSSNEKIGDKEYFKKLNEYLGDLNVIRTCYDYFKSIPNLDKFGNIPIPKTDYQDNLKEGNKSAIEMWLEDFTRLHYDEEIVEKLGSDIYKDFEFWRKENNVNYETSSVKMGIALINLKLQGITKGRHTRYGDTKYFNIPLLKKHFGIGVLVDLE